MPTPARDFGRGRQWTAGTRIRQRRADLGLTQADVVSRLAQSGLDLTDGSLSNMERGQGLVVGKLPALAVALECTVTYLLGLTANPGKWTPDESMEIAATRVKFDAKVPHLALVTGDGRASPLSKAQHTQPPLVRGVSSSPADTRHRREDD